MYVRLHTFLIEKQANPEGLSLCSNGYYAKCVTVGVLNDQTGN